MNQFGGSWTKKKLSALEKYLSAYRTIFTGNKRARYFRAIYIDGFAGSGEWKRRESENTSVEREQSLFETFETEEIEHYAKGSVQIALSLESPFDEYVFIEKNEQNASDLNKMIRSKYAHLEERVTVIVGDCNLEMKKIVENYNWEKYRAVCLLDPYGMSIQWNTIEAIAGTRAIDMWLLFPLGIGVCRLLMKKRIPEGGWAEKLTTILGTDDWRKAFYRESTQQTLFGDEYEVRRTAGVDEIGSYFIKRLKSIFPGVIDEPLILRNSKNNPLYLYCFAVGNKRAVRPALGIAKDIIGRA